jgi:hypothetical protein
VRNISHDGEHELARAASTIALLAAPGAALAPHQPLAATMPKHYAATSGLPSGSPFPPNASDITWK